MTFRSEDTQPEKKDRRRLSGRRGDGDASRCDGVCVFHDAFQILLNGLFGGGSRGLFGGSGHRLFGGGSNRLFGGSSHGLLGGGSLLALLEKFGHYLLNSPNCQL